MKLWSVIGERKVGDTETSIMAMVVAAENIADANGAFGAMFEFSHKTTVSEGISDDSRLTGIFNPLLLERVNEVFDTTLTDGVHVLLYANFTVVFN